jgi:hypothetical protein
MPPLSAGQRDRRSCITKQMNKPGYNVKYSGIILTLPIFALVLELQGIQCKQAS